MSNREIITFKKDGSFYSPDFQSASVRDHDPSGPINIMTSVVKSYNINNYIFFPEREMDIEAMSGPRLSESVHSVIVRDEIEPVTAGGPLAVIGMNVRDRVTISREARRRLEEWLAKKEKKQLNHREHREKTEI